MNFLRLSDDLLSVLYEDDEIIAIDKPYGFNAHTNDSKEEHGEAIQDGLIEIYEKQLGVKLHIIHRLDQTTTGVMIFGKSSESAKKYAEFFYERKVQKTYWFVTKNRSEKKRFFIDKTIVHKGKDLEATTDLKFLDSNATFALWEAKPHTGRNHQIRIHAQSAGISILGDSKYEGAEYPFLCLHNHQIEFPNGLIITSHPPIYFQDLDLLTDPELSIAFFEVDRRYRLYKQVSESNECYRMVHNKNGSEVPGYTLDHYGAYLILNWYRPKWIAIEESKFQYLADVLEKPILVNIVNEKRKLILGNSGSELPHSWVVKESQIQYEVRSESPLSTGLVLNQRLQRKWLSQNASGKTVLSLFAYTGGYALAATLGGATEVAVVEYSKNNLEWAKKNFILNSLSIDRLKFLYRDSLTFVEQCLSKNIKFDIITCDVPTFYRREKGIFQVEKDLEHFLENMLSLLNEKGQLILNTQFDGFYINDLRQMIQKVKKTKSLPELEIATILPSLDFEMPDQKSNLKSFLICLK